MSDERTKQNSDTENNVSEQSNCLLEMIKCLQSDIAEMEKCQQQNNKSTTKKSSQREICIETSHQREYEMFEDIDLYASQNEAYDNEEEESLYGGINVVTSADSNKGDKISESWAKLITESFTLKKKRMP